MMFYFNFMSIFVVLNILIFLTMNKSDSTKNSSMKLIPKMKMSKPKNINKSPKKVIKFKAGADLAGKVK